MMYKTVTIIAAIITIIAMNACEKKIVTKSDCQLTSVHYLDTINHFEIYDSLQYLDGKVVKRLYIDVNNPISSYNSIYYINNKVSVIYRYSSPSTLFEIDSFLYDTNGRLSVIERNRAVFTGSDFHPKTDFIYDSDNKVISVKDATEDPNYYILKQFTYSGNNIVTSTHTYFQTGIAVTTTIFTFEYSNYKNPVINLGQTNYFLNIDDSYETNLSENACTKITENTSLLTTTAYLIDNSDKITSAVITFSWYSGSANKILYHYNCN